MAALEVCLWHESGLLVRTWRGEEPWSVALIACLVTGSKADSCRSPSKL